MGFLTDVCPRFDKTVPGFEQALLRQFEDVVWPENVRQLLREDERLVALDPGGQLLAASLGSADLPITQPEPSVEPRSRCVPPIYLNR